MYIIHRPRLDTRPKSYKITNFHLKNNHVIDTPAKIATIIEIESTISDIWNDNKPTSDIFWTRDFTY